MKNHISMRQDKKNLMLGDYLMCMGPFSNGVKIVMPRNLQAVSIL